MTRFLLLFASLWSMGLPAQDNRLLLVDLREAYERSSALQQLLVDVDRELTRVADAHEARAAPLREELQALKTSRMHEDEKRKRRASLLLSLTEAEEAMQSRAQAVGAANEQAVAAVDAAIAEIEEALKVEHAARAVLRAQDVLWYRAGAPFDVTDTLYERLNQRLPKVDLSVASAAP